MLELKNLVCGYEGRKVLQPLDARLEPGSLLFLLGPNGSGKSTLIRTLSGGLKALGGEFLLPEISHLGRHAAYLPAVPEIHPALTGRDLLDLFQASRSPWHSDRLLGSLGVNDLIKRPVGELSSGERRRVTMTAVLSHPSSVVLLDEPLNFLDWSSALALEPVIKEQKKLGRIFVIATHELNWALRFDDSAAWALGNAQLATAGKTSAVLASKEFQTTFKIKTQVIENPLDGSKLLAISPES